MLAPAHIQAVNSRVWRPQGNRARQQVLVSELGTVDGDKPTGSKYVDDEYLAQATFSFPKGDPGSSVHWYLEDAWGETASLAIYYTTITFWGLPHARSCRISLTSSLTDLCCKRLILSWPKPLRARSQWRRGSESRDGSTRTGPHPHSS